MKQYNQNVLNHFFNPHGVDDGSLIKATEHQFGSIGFSDVIQLKLLVERNCIQALHYKVIGGPYLIACLSWLSEYLQDKPLTEIEKITVEKLVNMFDIPKTKFYVAIISIDAVKQVINKWEEQND